MNEIDEIDELLRRAKDFSLLTEVVYQALFEMKSNPHITIIQAIERACDEWDV